MQFKTVIKIVLPIIFIVVLIVTVYYTFFFSYTCKDIACFRSHQEKCSRTKFVYDTQDTIWKYNILGKENGRCEISVKILQVKTGNVANKKLEGEKMNCFVPLGSIVSPDADISLCHGVLKEELQNLIIQKLHSYILNNLGQIEEGLGAGNILGSSVNSTNVSA